MRLLWASPREVIFSTLAILFGIVSMTGVLWEIFGVQTLIAFAAPLVGFFGLDWLLPPWSDVPRYYIVAYLDAIIVITGIFALYSVPLLGLGLFALALLIPLVETI